MFAWLLQGRASAALQGAPCAAAPAAPTQAPASTTCARQPGLCPAAAPSAALGSSALPMGSAPPVAVWFAAPMCAAPGRCAPPPTPAARGRPAAPSAVLPGCRVSTTAVVHQRPPLALLQVQSLTPHLSRSPQSYGPRLYSPRSYGHPSRIRLSSSAQSHCQQVVVGAAVVVGEDVVAEQTASWTGHGPYYLNSA
jgi:hypothetical protein